MFGKKELRKLHSSTLLVVGKSGALWWARIHGRVQK